MRSKESLSSRLMERAMDAKIPRAAAATGLGYR
jgi:hypothetical protein